MPRRTRAHRRTPAESDATRAEVIRLHGLGVTTRKAAKALGISQSYVCKVLREWREDEEGEVAPPPDAGYQPSKGRQADTAAGAGQPDTGGGSLQPTAQPAAQPMQVSQLDPAAFFAHAVDELERDIVAARSAKSFGSIAGLRKVQAAAHDQLSAARGAVSQFDELTEGDLARLIGDVLGGLPDELRDATAPQPSALVEVGADREVG